MVIKPLNKLESVMSIHDLLDKTSVVLSRVKSGELTIDLSSLRFITPIGYTSLLSILNYLEERYNVRVIVPIDDRPVKYMERMNFFEVCSENIKAQFDELMDMEVIYNRNRSNLKTDLMETKKARDYDAIEDINDAVKDILRKKGFKGPRLSNIQTFITELGNNVIDHTNSPCYISIKSNDEHKEIEIAVSDCGEGIYESLKGMLSGKQPDEVINAAITTKASRLIKENRGNGLMDVKQKAFHPSNKVELSLCTNNTVYLVKQQNVRPIVRGNSCFGTFYQIKINYPS